jgi:hypothetical protein
VAQMLNHPGAEKHLFSLLQEENDVEHESREVSLSISKDKIVDANGELSLGEITMDEVKDENMEALDEIKAEKIAIARKYSAKILRERDRCSVFGISHTGPNISPNSPVRHKEISNESSNLPMRTRSVGDMTGSQQEQKMVTSDVKVKPDISESNKISSNNTEEALVDESALLTKLTTYLDGLESNSDLAHTTFLILKILYSIIHTSKATKQLLLSNGFQFLEILTLVLVNYTLLSPVVTNPQLGIFSNLERNQENNDLNGELVSEEIALHNDFSRNMDIYDYIYTEKYTLSKPLIVQVSVACLQILQSLCVLKIGKSRFHSLLKENCMKIEIQANVSLTLKNAILQRPLNVLALIQNEVAKRAYSNLQQYIEEESITILNNEMKRVMTSEEFKLRAISSQISSQSFSKYKSTSAKVSDLFILPKAHNDTENTSTSSHTISGKKELDTKTNDGLKTLLHKEILATTNNSVAGRRTTRKKSSKRPIKKGSGKIDTEEEEDLTSNSKENLFAGPSNTKGNNNSSGSNMDLPPLYNSVLKTQRDNQSNEVKGAMLEYFGNTKTSVNLQLEKSPPRYGDLLSSQIPNSSSTTGRLKYPDKLEDKIVEIEPIERDNDNNAFAVPCINGCLIPLPDGMNEYNRIRCKKCKGKLQISM